MDAIISEVMNVISAIDINVLSLIVSPVAGLIGVFIGSWLNRKSSIDVQKKFLAKQIRLEKLQGVSEDLGDLIHVILELNVIASNRVNNSINEQEFESQSHLHFQKVMRIFKDVQIKDLFLEEVYRKKIDKLRLMYTKAFNQTQNDFLKDENIKRKEVNEILNSDVQEIFYVSDYVYEITNELNDEIERELTELTNK
ncbi:hypothetical protein ACKXGF_07715 [Alkalibacillus sp. S2W]|uniref:hypothetical protein n=1 Tax=Alkalibacillus sp. S2W TaxID=3386553 RepID=UPI00398D198E